MRRLALARPPFLPSCLRAWPGAGLLILAVLLLAVTAGRPALAQAQPMPGMPGSGQPQAAAEAEWWVSLQGTALGPYDLDDLFDLAEAGEITLRTYVWREGMAAWTRLGEVTALKAVAKEIAFAEEEQRGRAFKDYLLGTWSLEGAVRENGDFLAVSVRLSIRDNDSFSWAWTRRYARGETDTRFDSGSFVIQPKDAESFSLLMKAEDFEVEWEVVVRTPDRFEVLSLGLFAERM